MKKILIVEKCDECRNRVLIEETSWNGAKMTKITEAQCNQVYSKKDKSEARFPCGYYGLIIKTYPDIPKWCPLEDYKEADHE